MNIPIECRSCGATGEVLRVTANLQCRCGSRDLDLYDGQKTAASGGTGWNQSRPDQDVNWDEYAGPTPGHNPRGVEDADANHVCPACNGTGHDSRASGGGYDETTCRNCHGTGKVTYASDSHGPTNDAHVPQGPPLGASDNKTSAKKKTVKSKVAVPGIKGTKVVTATQGDKIMRMAAKIVETNSGLSTQEAFELARRAVASFPEDGDK